MFENDEDDDWFYKSIKMYETLQMFELRLTPQKVVQASSEEICIAGSCNEKYELLLVRIPKKLTLPEGEQSRCKDNDFLIVAGCFLEHPVECLGYLSSSILISQKNGNGIKIYKQNGSDILNVCKTILDKIPSPTFSYSNEFVVAVKDTSIFIIDNTFSCLEYLAPDYVFNDSLIPCFKDINNIFLLNKLTGNICNFDKRSNTFSSIFNKSHGQGLYTYNMSDCYIGVLSNMGDVFLIDQRNYKNPVSLFNVGLGSDGNNLKFNFSQNSKTYSLSGFDSTVSIYSIDNKLIFSHQGHTKLANFHSASCCVTDHIWCPNVSDNLIVSCCDNSTVNCWEYSQQND